jgi:ABC-2 type transport system ATP-binding protein
VRKETILQTDHITKDFGSNKAVDQVSLHVNKGEIYGFLGPNGSGKTTIMAMILGLLPPDAGSIELFGIPFGGTQPQIRQRIGVVQEKPYLYMEMTAIEYLKCFAQIYSVKNPVLRSQELLDKLDLGHAAGNRIGTFSRGMQQRVSIARALLHRPELLLLDEPVSGLDPHGIRLVRDILLEIRKYGTTVFLSSHILSEAEKVCDRVGIINRGTLLAEETIQSLSYKLTNMHCLEISIKGLNGQVLERLDGLSCVNRVQRLGNHLSIEIEPHEDSIASVSQTIFKAGAVIMSLTKNEPSLEEAFLKITEKNISMY